MILAMVRHWKVFSMNRLMIVARITLAWLRIVRAPNVQSHIGKITLHPISHLKEASIPSVRTHDICILDNGFVVA